MHENCENKILAKTLKIVLPSRRNTNFQEIDVAKEQKKQPAIIEILRVFGAIDSMCCARTAALQGGTKK